MALFSLDAFALRQWEADYSGTRMTYPPGDFVRRVHAIHAEGVPLEDGYAPFCKHLFVPNFTEAVVGCLPITDETRPLLRTDYLARTPHELPVLRRWFPRSSVQHLLHRAHYLDIILYTREQIRNEQAAQGLPDDGQETPWGIISIKAQDEPHETPMDPITMIRNALGKAEGGSGVPICREQYAASVEYWRVGALVSDDE